MARSVNITRTVAITSGSSTILSLPAVTKQKTQTTDRYILLTKSVGTSEESVDPSTLDISTNGYCYIINLDSTNTVDWGGTTGDYVGTVEASDYAGPFQLKAGKTLYLKANTAACEVQILITAK